MDDFEHEVKSNRLLWIFMNTVHAVIKVANKRKKSNESRYHSAKYNDGWFGYPAKLTGINRTWRVQELNSGPRAPKARIMPLDHRGR